MVDTSGHDHTWTQEVVEWSVSTVGKWSPPDQDQTLNIQSYNDHLSPGYQNIHTNLGSQNQNQILYHIIILIHLQRSFVVKLYLGFWIGPYLDSSVTAVETMKLLLDSMKFILDS